MERDRLQNALNRIENSFARIGAAVEKLDASIAATAQGRPNQHDIQLRETIRASLRDLDTLISRLEQ